MTDQRLKITRFNSAVAEHARIAAACKTAQLMRAYNNRLLDASTENFYTEKHLDIIRMQIPFIFAFDNIDLTLV
jgi:hypothetical protein